jgi:hypothetical protein
MPLGQQGTENEQVLHNPKQDNPTYAPGSTKPPSYTPAEKFPKNPSGRPAHGNPNSTHHIGHEGPRE